MRLQRGDDISGRPGNLGIFSNQEREFQVERITLSPEDVQEFCQSLKNKVIFFIQIVQKKHKRVNKTNFMRLPG